jgi:hypothetical protein
MQTENEFARTRNKAPPEPELTEVTLRDRNRRDLLMAVEIRVFLSRYPSVAH